MNKSKHQNEQKSRGHQNESNVNEENKTERWKTFEDAEKLTNAAKSATEKYDDPKGEENEQNGRRRAN
jgi:hypothetical protein